MITNPNVLKFRIFIKHPILIVIDNCVMFKNNKSQVISSKFDKSRSDLKQFMSFSIKIEVWDSLNRNMTDYVVIIFESKRVCFKYIKEYTRGRFLLVYLSPNYSFWYILYYHIWHTFELFRTRHFCIREDCNCTCYCRLQRAQCLKSESYCI